VPEQAIAPEPSIEDRLLNHLTQEEEPAATPPAPETKETQPTETEPEPGAEEAAAEGDSPPEQAEGEEEGEASTEEETADDDAEVTTLDGLAQALELTPEELTSSIQITTQDGEQVPLSAVIEQFGKPAGPQQTPAEVQQAVAQFETHRTKLQQEHDAKLGELQQLTGQLIGQIEAEKDIDWAKLEEEDPVEYVKQRQKALDRRETVRASMETMRAEAEKRQADEQKTYQEWRQAEAQKILVAMPQWADPEKAKPDMEMLGKYLERTGFTPEEIDRGGALNDSRYLITAFKAAQYDLLQRKKKVTVKKVRTLPKMVKGGARREATREDVRKRAAQRAKLKETGSVQDAAALMEELL
jgi:hypothetical protein